MGRTKIRLGLTVAALVLSSVAASTVTQAQSAGSPTTWFNGSYTATPTAYIEPGLPPVSPAVLASSRLVWNLEVTSKPSTKPMSFQICMWQHSPAKRFRYETCSAEKAMPVSTVGKYAADLGVVSKWWKIAAGYDLTKAPDVVRIMIKDASSTPYKLMMTSLCGNYCYVGSDIGSHLPMSIRSSAVLYPTGTTPPPTTPPQTTPPPTTPPPSTAVPAGSTVALQATGVAGVPAGASAVAVNLTIVGALAPGFATLYPCGSARPDASNINYAAGQTIANSAVAKPGVGGKICIYTSASADILLDMAGFFPAGSDYTPILNPARTLDTRNGIGAPAADLFAGQTLELASTGVAGVPADASAIALTLTIVGATAPGFATLFPCGATRPDASNINYAAGQTIAASAIAKPGTGGKICIYTSATADVLVDVAGYFPAGSVFTTIPNPARTLDTRNGIGAPAADLLGGQTLELASTGVAGVPAGASAVAVNLTIVGALAPGFATLYPCGSARPDASNINYAAGQTIANSAVAKPGVGGKICIYTYATADVLVDVAGFFPAGSDYTPIPNPTRVLDTRNGIG